MKDINDKVFADHFDVQCCGHTCEGVVPEEEYDEYRKKHWTKEHNSPPVETKIACLPGGTKSDLQALRQKVFDKMSSEAQFQAVVSKEFLATPLNRGSCCTKVTLIQNDPAVVQRCDQSFTLTNHTLPGHHFHPGYVRRTVSVEGSCVFVNTTGRGVGPCAVLNERVGPALFKLIDLRLKDSLGYPLNFWDRIQGANALRIALPTFTDAGQGWQAFWDQLQWPTVVPSPPVAQSLSCGIEQVIHNPSRVPGDIWNWGRLPTVPILTKPPR